MGMETSGRRRLLLILKLIISTDKLIFCRGLFNSVRLGALCLEALAVDDGGAALVVLLLGDPHLLEGGAMILILMVEGARAVISFCMRSAIPGYMVVPPDMTVLAYRSFLMSTSHFMMEL